MISIIIPVYNVQEYIIKCLESVIAQTFTGAMECLIIDDCGIDDSIRLAENFIESYNGLIEFRIIKHDHNKGLSVARNTGIDESRGEFVTFIDSDDYVSPFYIQKLYDAINIRDDIFVSTCQIYKDQDGALCKFDDNWNFVNNKIYNGHEFLKSKMLLESPFSAWGKMYRRQLIKNVRFRVNKLNEDTLFMYDIGQIMKLKKYNEVIIPDYLIYYRIRLNSICTSQDRLFLFEVIKNYYQLHLEAKNNDKELSVLLLHETANKLFPLVAYNVLGNKETTIRYYADLVSYIKAIPLLYVIRWYYKESSFRFYMKIRLLPFKTVRDIYGNIHLSTNEKK